MKGVSSKELVRQGFWNGVGNLALGALVVGALAALAFLVPSSSAKTATAKSKAPACGCSS